MSTKEKHIVKVELGTDGKLRSLDAKTGKWNEIVPRFNPSKVGTDAARKYSRDAPKLTKRELAEMRPVHVEARIDVGVIRKKLRLSQSLFASQFGITLAVLKDWEQGRRLPDATARAFLKVIENEPNTVRRILQSS